MIFGIVQYNMSKRKHSMVRIILLFVYQKIATKNPRQCVTFGDGSQIYVALDDRKSATLCRTIIRIFINVVNTFNFSAQSYERFAVFVWIYHPWLW